MLAETISVGRTAGSLLPLDTLGGTIKAHIAAGDKATDKAEEHYKAAGIHLSEAKERVARTKNLTWPAYLGKHCRISNADSRIVRPAIETAQHRYVSNARP
jgi:hypothetical protein